MKEERYLELLAAAPPIKRDEITRVSQYQPQPAEIPVSVFVALEKFRRLPPLRAGSKC